MKVVLYSAGEYFQINLSYYLINITPQIVLSWQFLNSTVFSCCNSRYVTTELTDSVVVNYFSVCSSILHGCYSAFNYIFPLCSNSISIQYQWYSSIARLRYCKFPTDVINVFWVQLYFIPIYFYCGSHFSVWPLIAILKIIVCRYTSVDWITSIPTWPRTTIVVFFFQLETFDKLFTAAFIIIEFDFICSLYCV